MKFVIPLVAFLGLAVMFGLGLQRDPRALESALLQQPVPQFDLPVLGGEAHERLNTHQLYGRVWVLNVWASWCAPCRQELPILVNMGRKDQVAIYGLNYKDDPVKAQVLLKVAGSPYVASAVDLTGRVGMDFGIQAVPETFVIDKQGVVRYRHLGPVSQEVWEQKLMPVVRAVQ